MTAQNNELQYQLTAEYKLKTITMMPRVASCKLENTNSDVLVSIMQKYTALLEENQEQKSELERTRSMLLQYSKMTDTGRS